MPSIPVGKAIETIIEKLGPVAVTGIENISLKSVEKTLKKLGPEALDKFAGQAVKLGGDKLAIEAFEQSVLEAVKTAMHRTTAQYVKGLAVKGAVGGTVGVVALNAYGRTSKTAAEDVVELKHAIKSVPGSIIEYATGSNNPYMKDAEYDRAVREGREKQEQTELTTKKRNDHNAELKKLHLPLEEGTPAMEQASYFIKENGAGIGMLAGLGGAVALALSGMWIPAVVVAVLGFVAPQLANAVSSSAKHDTGVASTGAQAPQGSGNGQEAKVESNKAAAPSATDLPSPPSTPPGAKLMAQSPPAR